MGESGYAAVLNVNDGTATTTIANCTSIGGPNQSRNSIAVGDMDSTNHFFDYLPGMIDPGEITAELNYGATTGGVAGLLNALMAHTATNLVYQVEVNDAGTSSQKSTWACVGHMTALGQAIPFDDKITQSITVKLSGAPSHTAAS